jgi:hypothetical protein
MASEKNTLFESLIFGLGKIRRGPLSERRAPLKYAREARCASDACSRSARKYACGSERFAKLLNLPSWMSNCWSIIFSVLLKIDGCQVDLANSWRYSSVGFRFGSSFF